MPITIRIFDVGHGACAVITTPQGKLFMIDCGHSNDRPWRPSLAFAGQEIESLVVSNYDEDHVSDLENLMAKKPPKPNWITRNPSVGPTVLRKLKMENGMGPGIARLERWMVAIEGKTFSGGPNAGGMQRSSYYNNYPDFQDENNLSVVTFIEYAGFRALFPGDLEAEGWRKLLERSAFQEKLGEIDLFVASHHGRKTGCCDEVFEKICRPRIVVMSDRDKQFDSQETTDWYHHRSGGIDFNGGRRHVFTTRRDGDITIQVHENNTWSITTQKG